MSTSSTDNSTLAKAVAYTGAIGNVVVESKPVTVTGFTLAGGAAGATFRVFDNATTNTGDVIFAATLAANTVQTYPLPTPVRTVNGVTINASAAGGAGTVHALSAAVPTRVRSYTGGTTAAQVVRAVPVNSYGGFIVNASNTGGASTITVYDNASAASGTILHQVTIPTQTAANTQMFVLPTSVRVSNGITISVATTAVGDISFLLG